jgi:chromosome partitioning protein
MNKPEDAAQAGGAVSTPPTPAEVRAMNARDALELIISRSPAWMEQLKRLHAPADGIKTVRTFRSTEAARLVGRSTAWLRDNEAHTGRPERAEGGAWRTYSIEDVNALRDHAGTRPHRNPDEQPQVLAMLNFKGGASKTTTTHLFAHYLAVAGYRVLLLDLDPQGSLTGSFDITNRHGQRQEDFDWEDSIGPILTGETDELVPLIMKTHWPTIDIVPAAIDSYDAELTIAVETAREGASQGDEFWLRVDRALSMVDGYDIVLIDSAPALSFGLINAYMAATGVIVPTPARVVDLQAMQKFAEFLHRWIVKMEQVAPSRRKWLRLLFSQFAKGSVTEQTNSQVSRNYLGSLIMTAPMASSEAIKRGVGGAPSPYEGSTGGVGKSIASANARVREQLDEPFRELLALVESGWSRNTRAKG